MSGFLLSMVINGVMCWFYWRRGHSIGWYRGYFARKNEDFDGENLDVPEEEALKRGRMYRYE